MILSGIDLEKELSIASLVSLMMVLLILMWMDYLSRVKMH